MMGLGAVSTLVLGPHDAVIAANESESGISIHYVNERYDEGNILQVP